MVDVLSSLLVRTKLRPPRLAPELAPRARLLERLDDSRSRPLILVSAPGGYGKSTLVASWLAHSDIPSGWLTLDEHDDDLPVFLEYVVEAIRTVVPGACPGVREVVRHWDRQDSRQVATLLLNELDSLPTPVTLVLDDFHLIRDSAVVEVVNALLRHPPAPLQVVLVVRFDPPLELASLRARGQLLELREADLRFRAEELESLLGGALPSEEVARRVLATTEGWAVGLQFVRTRLEAGEELDDVLDRLAGGAGGLHQFLATEIVGRLPAARRPQVLAASLPERFCDAICTAMLAEDDASPEEDDRGLVEWMQEHGLFLVPLDERGEWFRFHGLLRDVLRRELEQTSSSERRSQLHRRAGRWLEGEGLYDEALSHYEQAGDDVAAIALVENHRIEAANAEDWSRLGRWLARLPPAVVQVRPQLLLARAWVLEDQAAYPALFETLDALEAIVAGSEGASSESWQGELDALRSIALYFQFDGEALVETAGRALVEVSEDNLPARAMAVTLLGWGHQMRGDLRAAESVIFEELRDEGVRGTTVQATALAALAFIYFAEGDLGRLEQAARELQAMAEEQELGKSAGFARYLLAVAQIERGDLADAEATLKPLVGQPPLVDMANWFHGMLCVALALYGRGRHAAARDVAERASAGALALARPELLDLCAAFEAELAVREGRVAEAAEWARSFEPSMTHLRNRLFQPEMTYVKVLLAVGTSEALGEAARFLEDLERHLSSIHHRRFLIDVWLLDAVRMEACEQRGAAVEAVRRAVDEALPRGLRRPFLELSPALDPLLEALAPGAEETTFAESLFAGSDQGSRADVAGRRVASGELVERLTVREAEVLELLAARLSDKEIAADLGIASKTVKRHNSNLFSKLGVNSRREAVRRARELGLLPELAGDRRSRLAGD